MLHNAKLNFLDFDIYSRRISFFYDGKEKIGSNFGFILTLFYVIFSIICFFIYFINTIKRGDVTASDSTIYPTEIPFIEINKNLFYFAFGLENPTSLVRFIDEEIYYPEVEYFEGIKEDGGFIPKIRKVLNVEKCDIKNFGENYYNLLNKDELNNLYCLEDFNLTLIGGFKFDKMSFIRINIYPCVNNSKNNNHCKPQSEIDKYLSSGYFSALIKDIGLNPFNYTFPTVPLIQDLYTTIDKSIQKEFIIYLGIQEIDTDIGLFSDNIKKETHLKYIKDFNNFYFMNEEEYHSGEAIISAQIRLEDNIYFQKRTYTKMSHVFSTTGGYMQLIYTVFALITLLTKKISLEKKLINSLFNFNIKKKKIILSIEYEKKLDYNSSMDKRKEQFIPYEARKSIIKDKKKKDRRTGFLVVDKKNNATMVIKSDKDQRKFNAQIKKLKNTNTLSEKGLSKFSRKLSKIKELNTNLNDLSVNRSKVNMLNKSDYMNSNQINNIFEQKKVRKYDSNLNILQNLRVVNKGNCSIIDFNIFDYYCLRKITKKSTEIELFNFGLNFYKSQMDIINFFNIILLTQIMLTQKSDKKQNILSQTIELSIK